MKTVGWSSKVIGAHIKVHPTVPKAFRTWIDLNKVVYSIKCPEGRVHTWNPKREKICHFISLRLSWKSPCDSSWPDGHELAADEKGENLEIKLSKKLTMPKVIG